MKNGSQINKEFLDTLDFIPFLKTAPTISTLIMAIETYIFLNHIELPPELEQDAFHYFSMADFKEYLEKRYNTTQLRFFSYTDYIISYTNI